jgi:DNA-binding protein HU-beta
MSKKDLVNQIAEEAGITKDQANKAIDALVQSITKSLANREEVRLPGFGTFLISDRKARDGRNPSTGEAIKIPAAKQPKFRPSQALKDAANAA